MEHATAAAGAFGLALVHLLADRLHSRDRRRRAWWLSFAGGTSVAFVFMHLMPELTRGQREVRESGFLPALDDHVFLAALLGVVIYYGAERFALRRSRRGDGRAGSAGSDSQGFFWAHIGLFTVFNVLTGVLLVREAERQLPAAFGVLWAAFALHLFSNDFALRDHHRADYHRVGRWVLAAAVLVGWALAALLDIGEAGFVLPLAFATGGIVLNAMKEELPAERESRFGAFVVGAALYTGIILLV